jgi:hypothetical protein
MIGLVGVMPVELKLKAEGSDGLPVELKLKAEGPDGPPVDAQLKAPAGAGLSELGEAPPRFHHERDIIDVTTVQAWRRAPQGALCFT